ncbi:MAG: hypothetical protein HYW24_03290 [Candidatus Aenigmarchaeota archaeon]|nr:hypothetical protein [Candidatus Aenigmarchaeota archaeon]
MSQSFIEYILQTNEFTERLIKARKITEETSLETGFVVARKFMEGEYIKQPHEYKIGNLIISGDNESIPHEYCGLGYADGLYDFIDFHFHQDFESYYIPSPSDIRNLNQDRIDLYELDAINSQRLSIVGSYDKRKRMHLFMFQEKTPKPVFPDVLEEFCERYEKDIFDLFSIRFIEPNVVVQYFNDSGLYVCEMVTATRKGIKPEDVPKLKNFTDQFSVDTVRLDQLIKDNE